MSDIMTTFKDLLDQLQKLTPEQLQQEVKFVKYGASSDYDWSGLAEDSYSEDSKRVRLASEPEGVWYIDDEYSDGIVDGLILRRGLADGKLDITPVFSNLDIFRFAERNDFARTFGLYENAFARWNGCGRRGWNGQQRLAFFVQGIITAVGQGVARQRITHHIASCNGTTA